MEMQNFINSLTALFLPPAVVPIRGREVWVHVPSSLAVAHGRGCHSAAIALRLNFILPRGGTGQAHGQPSLDGGGKRGEGNQPLGGTGRGGVGTACGRGTGCPVPRPPSGFLDQLPNQAGGGGGSASCSQGLGCLLSWCLNSSSPPAPSYVDLMGKTTVQSGILQEDTMSSTLLT